MTRALVANWVTNEVLRELQGHGTCRTALRRLSCQGKLVKLIDQGTISATIGKEVFAAMLEAAAARSRSCASAA